MIEGKGKFLNRPTMTGKKLYDKFFIYIPTEIARDGLFPFTPNEELKINIDKKGNRLVIEKLK